MISIDHAITSLYRKRPLLNFFLQRCLEELQEQILLPLIRGVVIHGEDDRLDEVVCLSGLDFENQLAEVRRVCLKKYYVTKSNNGSNLTSGFGVTFF